MQWSVGEDGAATAVEEKKPALKGMESFVNTTRCFGTSYPCGLKLFHAIINTGLEFIYFVIFPI